MPATWRQITAELGYNGVDPHEAHYAIDAGAYYMRGLRGQWSSARPAEDRQALAQASYNTGLGNMLAAQRLCLGVAHWPQIAPCLHMVTGKDALQTIGYVSRIAYWRGLLQ